ncbi:MAG TPA: glycosyltransferase family 25 protein [Rhodoferax sp.]
MQTLPVYVISLKDAFERRALIKKHLHTLGIEHEIIDAVNGEALSPEYLREVNPTQNLSPGQIGCYLSHIQVYERLIAQGTSVALILEDDTVLHPSVRKFIEYGCQSLDFDYCFVGSDDAGDAGYVYYDSSKPTLLSSQFLTYPLSSGPFCLHAYLITLEGAKKRVSCAYPARSAIDHYQYLPYKPRFMALIPMLAFVNELSAVQSMSSLNWSGLQTKARKHWWYYPMRDLMTLKMLRKLIALRRTEFPILGRWKSFASSFKVVRQSHLKNAVDPL